jgi:GxxExxY protein
MLIYKGLKDRIIGGIIAVHKTWGVGLLEAPYHNALYYELQSRRLAFEYNVPFSVKYRGQVVDEYFADLVFDRKVIIEVKSVRSLSPEMKAHFERRVLNGVPVREETQGKSSVDFDAKNPPNCRICYVFFITP